MMRYKYNVRELKDTDDGDIADVGTVEEMEAMSFKKLKAKLDHEKKYFVEYKNKRDNFVSVVTSGRSLSDKEEYEILLCTRHTVHGPWITEL